MPDGKKSGKVKKALRIAGSVVDVFKFVPGPHTPVLRWIEYAIDGAETINGPGGGGKKKALVLATLTDIFAALEKSGVYVVSDEVVASIPDIVDSLVAIKNEVNGFEAPDATTFRPGVATPVTFRGVMEPSA
jgi:methylaspartate ammonia-lyase